MITSMMRRALFSGDGSTLSLDFTTGVLDSRLTFTRASTGTFINASGNVATASNNVARFDYDPTTQVPRGLLIEGTATNLLNWSESFATSGGTNNNWADTHITRNRPNNTDPANGTNALRVTASATHGTIISTTAMGTSAARTFSIWLRRVSGTGTIDYTLDNGSTYTIQAITSSWVRYTFAATTAAQRVGIRIHTNGDSIELWGAQLEAGSGASSYIPTGASQATRNEDSATMSSVASLGFDQYQGTFIVRGLQTKHGISFARLLRIAGATTEPFGMPVNGVTLYGTSRNASNASIGETTRTNTLGQAFAFGMSLDANDAAAAMRVSLNGSGTSASRTNLGPTEAAASFSFNTNATPSNYGCFAVRSVKFFPTQKTLAQLNELTT